MPRLLPARERRKQPGRPLKKLLRHIRLLPKIREAVGDKLILIADGGMESGFDAFKALALGADAVTVGRPLTVALKENGADGVRDKIKEMTDQLLAMMYRTSSADIRHIDPSVIWEK